MASLKSTRDIIAGCISRLVRSPLFSVVHLVGLSLSGIAFEASYNHGLMLVDVVSQHSRQDETHDERYCPRCRSHRQGPNRDADTQGCVDIEIVAY